MGQYEERWTVQEDREQREAPQVPPELQIHNFFGGDPEDCAMVLGKLRGRQEIIPFSRHPSFTRERDFFLQQKKEYSHDRG